MYVKPITVAERKHIFTSLSKIELGKNPDYPFDPYGNLHLPHVLQACEEAARNREKFQAAEMNSLSLDHLGKIELAKMAAKLGEKRDWARVPKHEIVGILNSKTEATNKHEFTKMELLQLAVVVEQERLVSVMRDSPAIMPSSLHKTTDEAAKALSIGRYKLLSLLRNGGALTIHNAPTSQFIKRGLFTTSKNGRGILIANKGMDFIKNRIMPLQAAFKL